MELTGERIDIVIGEYELYRSPSWFIESQRGLPLSRAGVIVPDPDGTLFTALTVGSPLLITVGYRNQEPVTWSGTVDSIKPGDTRDQIEVSGVNTARPLTDTRIVQAWENETPEAILTWAINQAGLKVGVVASPGVVIPRFVASNIPVWQIAKQLQETCRTGFGLDLSGWALWLGSAGVNWSGAPEPGDVPTVATLDNLICHEPSTGSGWGQIETYLLPDLMHSREIRLCDDLRLIDTVVMAQRVRHEATPDRSRTFIWY